MRLHMKPKPTARPNKKKPRSVEMGHLFFLSLFVNLKEMSMQIKNYWVQG